MKRLFVMMIAALLSLSVPSYAVDDNEIYEVVSKQTDKGWIVRQFAFTESKMFAFCSAERMYSDIHKNPRSPTEAMLSFLLGDEVFGSVVLMPIPKSDNIPGEFDAGIEIDDHKFAISGGILQDDLGYRFTFPKKPEIVEHLMKGAHIKYIIEGLGGYRTMNFDLVGSRVALETVLACIKGGAEANMKRP